MVRKSDELPRGVSSFTRGPHRHRRELSGDLQEHSEGGVATALRRHLISAARVELARAALEVAPPEATAVVAGHGADIADQGGRLPSLTKRNTKKDLIKQKTQSIAEASSSLNTSKLDSALFQASETEARSRRRRRSSSSSRRISWLTLTARPRGRARGANQGKI